jgi:FkbH-like protein
MAPKDCKCLLIADFTIDGFAGYLSNDEDFPTIESVVAPFDQVVQVLMDGELECWKRKPDFAVVWTRPESIIRSFNQVLGYETVPTAQILEEVDEYASLLVGMSARVKAVLVPTWVSSPYHGGLGMLDLKTGVGVANTLMRMNLRLAESFDESSSIYLLDTQRWVAAAGKNAFNPKLWYMSKVAFGNDVFKEGVRDVKSALRGIGGGSKKLIVLDLDDTLWGGVVGDVGWEGVRLGGHDHIGEAYVDFQRALKSLTRRGVLLGIVSKNEEAVALEAITSHPEMVLRPEDFAGWKINWQDKAQNIVDLVSELNLGLQSVVFIDDNPVERARIREALSEVFVPEWPEDKMLYRSALLGLRVFDAPSVSEEDTERTRMYVLERQRNDLRKAVSSLDEWLRTLNTKIRVEGLNKANLQRAVQLLNKTNQMNLTTRRMTELEMADWARQDNHKLWTFRVADNFGDSGLTGIISLEVEDEVGRIVDFVLSCRVMGRKVEETMLYTVIKNAKSQNLDRIFARYVPTSRNKPCLDFWKSSGFACDGKDGYFTWELCHEYALPDCVKIEGEEEA